MSFYSILYLGNIKSIRLGFCPQFSEGDKCEQVIIIQVKRRKVGFEKSGFLLMANKIISQSPLCSGVGPCLSRDEISCHYSEITNPCVHFLHLLMSVYVLVKLIVQLQWFFQLHFFLFFFLHWNFK